MMQAAPASPVPTFRSLHRDAPGAPRVVQTDLDRRLFHAMRGQPQMLCEYLARFPVSERPGWLGETQSGACTPLLKYVIELGYCAKWVSAEHLVATVQLLCRHGADVLDVWSLPRTSREINGRELWALLGRDDPELQVHRDRHVLVARALQRLERQSVFAALAPMLTDGKGVVLLQGPIFRQVLAYLEL